jgi:L-asparagine transporter-like permease
MEDDWKLEPTEMPKSFKIKMIKKESILSVTTFLSMIYCFASVVNNSITQESSFVYMSRFCVILYIIAIFIRLIYKFRCAKNLPFHYLKVKVRKDTNQTLYEFLVLITVKIFLCKDIISKF